MGWLCCIVAALVGGLFTGILAARFSSFGSFDSGFRFGRLLWVVFGVCWWCLFVCFVFSFPGSLWFGGRVIGSGIVIIVSLVS